MASWLSGPRAAAGAGAGGDVPATGYAGQRLGYPEVGAGAVASFGSRLVALVIDWLACYLVAWAAVARIEGGDATLGDVRLWNTVLFMVEVWVLTSLTGASFGQRLRGLRVQRVAGHRLGPGRTLVRTALIMLVIPALIWDRDGRGLHDRVADSVVVRTGA